MDWLYLILLNLDEISMNSVLCYFLLNDVEGWSSATAAVEKERLLLMILIILSLLIPNTMTLTTLIHST